ncbi:Oligopeptide transporter 7 [Acorus calamus]|uniref:Oligopeptide transporter 7 n=1 Tax=Acorus calamus TaxID=4465 RepID=A0AAV9FEX0_ACOCL|nr:Oligopeptide transporter 7 [Acorus calamus]
MCRRMRGRDLYLSTFFAVTYGFIFASLTATISHVALFHGREIWEMSKFAFRKEKMDVHTRLMRVYKQVPQWWFLCVLLVNLSLTIFACEHYNHQLQLPWWGVLLACALAIVFTLPIGIITATTNQTPNLNVITELHHGVLVSRSPRREYVLQDVWVHQHETGGGIFARHEAWSLHENSTQDDVYGTGVRDAHRGHCGLGNGMVAHGNHPQHLQQGIAPREQPVDLSN